MTRRVLTRRPNTGDTGEITQADVDAAVARFKRAVPAPLNRLLDATEEAPTPDATA